MFFAHIIENNESVLCLLWFHLFKINVLNGEEYLRAYLADGVPLTYDGPVDSVGSSLVSEDSSAVDFERYCLYLLIEVENMN